MFPISNDAAVDSKQEKLGVFKQNNNNNKAFNLK
jgi:hypothetical protein